MLEVFRNSAKGTAGKVIVGLIVLTFVLFGAQSIVSIAGNTAPATVNGDDVSIMDYQRLLSARQQELASQYGAELAAQLANSDFLKNDVLENLISQTLQSQLSHDLEFSVSDEQILNTFNEIQAFQSDGKFDQDTYLGVLAMNGFTHQTFMAAQKSQSELTQLQSGVSDTAFVIDAIADQYAALDAQLRTVQYKTFNADDFKSLVELTDDEVNEYYEVNQAQFLSEERVQVKYLVVTVEEMTEDQVVTDDEIQSAYDSYLAELAQQETREISHILFAEGDNEDNAKTALARLEAGESFADLAIELSDDPGSAEFGGSLGVLVPDVYVPEFYDAAIALVDVGEVSELVETQYGVHLIRLDALDSPEAVAFEDKKEELVADLKLQKAEEEMLLVQTQLADEAFAADDIVTVAASFETTVDESEWFTRTDGDGYFADSSVVVAAFSDQVVRDGMISDVVKLNDGTLIAMQKVDYQPEDIQPLEEVMDQVTETLTNQRSVELMSEALKSELAEKDTDSDGWSEVVEMTRSDSSVPTAVRTKAFEMPKPSEGKTFAEVESDSVAYIIALEAVSEPAAEDLDAESSLAFMEQSSGAYQYQMLYNIVREAADVTIRN